MTSIVAVWCVDALPVRHVIGQRDIAAEIRWWRVSIVAVLVGTTQGADAAIHDQVGDAQCRAVDIRSALQELRIRNRDRAVLVHREGQRRIDDRRVVLAGDIDHDPLLRSGARSIRHRDRENILTRFTGTERLRPIIQRVGPVAILVDAQRAIAAVTVVHDRPRCRVALIDVGGNQFSGCTRFVILGHRTGRRPRYHRCVVGTGDGHTHLVRGGRARSVCCRHLEDVAVSLAGLEALRRVVVQRVGPAAVLVDNERAVGAMVVADAPGRAVADVGIRDIELARCGRHLVFCDGTAAGSGDHRIVVGAGDGNTHLMGRRRTRPIRHRDLEDVAVGLAGLQALRRVVVQRVSPVAVLIDNE